MSARVATLVFYDDGTNKWEHELSPGSSVQHMNAVPGYAGKVTGPTHDPYWLTVTGMKARKAS
jgi:hypothetical protein